MANEEGQKIVNAPAASEKKKRRFPLWQKIIAGVVIVGAAVVILAYLATSGAAKVSDQILNHIQNKQADQAYALFSREAKQATSQESFRETVDRIGPLLNTKAKQTG